MVLVPRQRRSKLVRVGVVVGLVLTIIFLIRSIRTETEDIIAQNLDSLQKLNELYKKTKQEEEQFVKEISNQESIDKFIEKQLLSSKQNNKLYATKKGKCPSYLNYCQVPHPPYTSSSLKLPFQRPTEKCRTFNSPAVETLIKELMLRLKDEDLARITENALPNTLDTTILYHSHKNPDNLETFVVTGDIHAEWLRDSARQLSIYQNLTKYDPDLQNLIKGAINTQAKYINISPYCNAFHPPLNSGVSRGSTAKDDVFPRPNWQYVFECKWEVDSLGSFLTLTREYYDNTKDISVFNSLWFDSMSRLLIVLQRETSPTFDENGKVLQFFYTFKRDTNIGSETLPLAGLGNPVNFDIGLVRSAFRPSDDATIYQFFIPGNAYLQVELDHIHRILVEIKSQIIDPKVIHEEKFDLLTSTINKFSTTIRKAIFEHGVVNHAKWGQVFAYEIDGYGGTNFMDDANIPSLLSLPDLGFVDRNNEIYQNTRKMILSKSGNPYYLQGAHFKGIGGPHVGIHNAWPMSLLMQIRTSDSDEEIMENLELIKITTGGLGLIHETIHVNSKNGYTYTRPWFSWANSEFGKTILDLAQRKPHLIFKDKYIKMKFDIDSILNI